VPQVVSAWVFERFTERTRQVVVFAQEEARSLRHNYIGTEHILLGLVRLNEGVAAAAAAGLGTRSEAFTTTLSSSQLPR